MSAEKGTALVIRSVAFSESSVIVTFFTREFGKISALAKGAKRPKGPFDNALDVLSLCRIVFLRKTSGALDLLTEARLERWFRPTDRDLARWYAAYYVAELLGELTQEYDPHPRLFDTADATLDALARADAPPWRLLRFEMAAMRELGHLPSLETCAECGRIIEARERVAFAMYEGGALCADCRLGRRGIVSISQAGWAALTELASAEPWDSGPPPGPAVMGELRSVMNRYVCHLLGKRPRLHEYLVPSPKKK